MQVAVQQIRRIDVLPVFVHERFGDPVQVSRVDDYHRHPFVEKVPYRRVELQVAARKQNAVHVDPQLLQHLIAFGVVTVLVSQDIQPTRRLAGVSVQRSSRRVLQRRRRPSRRHRNRAEYRIAAYQCRQVLDQQVVQVMAAGVVRAFGVTIRPDAERNIGNPVAAVVAVRNIVGAHTPDKVVAVVHVAGVLQRRPRYDAGVRCLHRAGVPFSGDGQLRRTRRRQPVVNAGIAGHDIDPAVRITRCRHTVSPATGQASASASASAECDDRKAAARSIPARGCLAASAG